MGDDLTLEKRKGWKSKMVRYLIYTLIILYIIWPLSIMIEESFRIDLSPFFAGRGVTFAGGIPFYSGGFNPSLINYWEAFTLEAFPRLVLNSAIIAVASVGTSLLIGTPAAYVLARHKFRGKGLLEFLVLSLRTISPFAVIIPFYVIYGRTGLWDTYLGMMLVYWVINLPVIVWMMKGFLSDIPKDIWEAAVLHGASEFTILRKVALPLVVPGLIATAVFAFVLTWNEFLYASILTGPVTKTVTKGIWFGMSEAAETFKVVEWDDINTAGTLAFIPAITMIILIRKYLVRGFTMGSSN